MELDAETLAAMRGEVDTANASAGDYRMELMRKNCPTAGQAANVARHERRKEARGPLMDAIAMWAGHERAAGRPDSQSYRKFYLRFGVDTLTAQTLDEKETKLLTEKINEAIG